MHRSDWKETNEIENYSINQKQKREEKKWCVTAQTQQQNGIYYESVICSFSAVSVSISFFFFRVDTSKSVLKRKLIRSIDMCHRSQLADRVTYLFSYFRRNLFFDSQIKTNAYSKVILIMTSSSPKKKKMKNTSTNEMGDTCALLYAVSRWVCRYFYLFIFFCKVRAEMRDECRLYFFL